MNITLDNDWFDAFSNSLHKSMGWDKKAHRYRNVEICLANHNRATIDMLAQEIGNIPACKETRHILGEIKRWNDITEGKQPRAANAKSAVSLLEVYIAQHADGFRLWRNVDGQWFGYFVTAVWYDADGRNRESNPTANIELECMTFGKTVERKLAFNSHQCRGKTAAQILASAELVVEDAAIAEQYAKAVEHHAYLCNRIGLQCYSLGNSFGREGRYDSLAHITSLSPRRDSRINGGPGLVVVDTVDDDEDKAKTMSLGRSSCCNVHLSILKASINGGKPPNDDYIEADAEHEESDLLIPIHPLVPVFDLIRHHRSAMHALDLQEYKYDKTISQKLILPEEQKRLLSLLVQSSGNEFKDIVASKSGGTVVLLAGRPGLGKTLSAEVFAECSERPLYRVQCSQLGVEAESIENELTHVFKRARRWNAVVLLDEADLYIAERGADINRNAIVCVFLRVLESQDGVLFLTTNLPETVDDAIASRCIARIDVEHPNKPSLRSIWDVLLKTSGVSMALGDVEHFVNRYSSMGGRDVKAAIKLAMVHSGATISREQMEFVLGFHPNRGQWKSVRSGA